MTVAEREKQEIQSAITRARDGVGDRIDELDRRLRTTFDVEAFAREHAPQIIAGGAAVGFLVGFGFPKPLKRVLVLGVPLAVIAWKVKQARDGAHSR